MMTNAVYISYDGALEALGRSQVLPYLKRLSQKDIKFFLVSFEKTGGRNIITHSSVKENLNALNIDWFQLRYHKRPPVLSTCFDIMTGLAVCLYIFFREKPKIIHARSYVAGLIAWIFKKIFRVKLIFDMRGFWADERVDGRIWAGKNCLYKIVKSVEKRLLENADEIIVLTEKAKNILKNWGYKAGNISVIPCCVDTDFFKFSPESRSQLRLKHGLKDKFIFAHTGSLEYWYMKDKMLDYFKAASKILPNAHFLILSADGCDNMRQMALNRNIGPERFTMLSVSFDSMPEYLSIVDAGIFFITPVFSKLASSPTKFAEYLSCGIPVIINEKIGDMDEYVCKKNIGVVVRNFCEQEYRQSFLKLSNMMQGGMRERCRAAAEENFSLELGADKYNQVYKRLI